MLHLWSLWPVTCVLDQLCVHFQLSVAYNRSGCLPQIPPVTIFIWLRNFKIFIFWTLDKRECWSLMVSTCRWFDINERFPQLSCYVHVCFLTWSWFYKLSWTCIGLIIIIIKMFNSLLDKKKKRGWSFKLVMFSE